MVRSQTNYILGTDSLLLQNVAFWDARHNTDHYLVLGGLHGSVPAAHSCYLGKRTHLSIRPPATPDKADHMFAKLWRAIPRPPRRKRHRQAWISPETWNLIDTRIETRQRRYQRSSRALGHAIKAALQGYRYRRAAEAGLAVESFLAYNPPLICKAWIWMRVWYNDTVDRRPHSQPEWPSP